MFSDSDSNYINFYDSNFDPRTPEKATPTSSLKVGLQRFRFHNYRGLIVECLKRVKATCFDRHDIVEKNLLKPFCCILRKDTFIELPMLDGLSKKF